MLCNIVTGVSGELHNAFRGACRNRHDILCRYELIVNKVNTSNKDRQRHWKFVYLS